MESMLSKMFSPNMILFIEVIVFSLSLGIMRRLFKSSWSMSLWLSAGLTTAVVLSLLILTGAGHFNLHVLILVSFPLLFVATGTIINFAVQQLGESGESANVNSIERQRTLEMVEQGKITPEEGAELLEALGRSNAMLGQDKFSKLDMLILAGVAITVLGFFLPWAYVRKGMYQSGQHIGAEGWAVLIIAVLAAVPVFVTPKDMLYKISMLQIFLLLLDCALIISLLFRVGNGLGLGLPVCLLGLGLAAFACFKKFKKLAS